MALLKANTGIGITNPTSALHVVGNGLFVGIVSAISFVGNIVGSATSASNLIGGERGSVPYQSALNTTTFISPGPSGNVLVTGGPGQDPYWSPISGVSGAVNGITIKDEGSLVGSAGSITSINFVGDNVTAIAAGSAATITVSSVADYLTGTAPASVITQSNGLDVSGNLNVSGTLSIGGTSLILNSQQLLVKDKNIVLGLVTNTSNNDISNDITANGGGISVASTVGSPILNIPIQVGINSNAPTYKQLMWIRQGTYTGMGTDAWVSNYAISIGNTSSVQNLSRLTVGAGFTVFDTYLDATDIRARNINTTGSIGVGTATTSEALDVVGNIRASGTITANSDETLKENIRTIPDALAKVLSLRGVEYDKIDNGDHQIGVIAQEVEKIIPEVVYPKGKHPDYEKKSVAYANLVGLLIEAIKEQNQRIDKLERQLGGW